MKSLSKYLCLAWLILYLFPFKLLAREIIIITFYKNSKKANLVKQILIKEINVPSQLIQLRQKVLPCLEFKSAILHICVSDNGLVSFPIIQQDILKYSFGIFTKDTSPNKTLEKTR